MASSWGTSPYQQTAASRQLLGRKLDPVRFCWDAGFEPDEWQERFLRSGTPARMLNCSRQVGKSTIVAFGALHRAVYVPNSLILLLSPGERQSGELMRKVFDAIQVAPDVPGIKSQGQLKLEFYNGSRIEALPGKEETVRGYSAVNILIVDEASRVPDSLFMAIQPMLAVSKGELWTLSSPFGTRGWWYGQKKMLDEDRKRGRKPKWDYYEVPADQCPRITPEFLAEEKRSMGEWWFLQEYMCQFLDAQTAAFGAEEIDATFAEDAIPWIIPAMTA